MNEDSLREWKILFHMGSERLFVYTKLNTTRTFAGVRNYPQYIPVGKDGPSIGHSDSRKARDAIQNHHWGLTRARSFFLPHCFFLLACCAADRSNSNFFGELDGSSVTRNNMAVPLEQILFRIRKFQTETTLIVYSGDKMNERHDVEDT
ncbi:hypothetical protein BLNAU_3944 [Blattamonas nauphoetae]|uniref:Uncharacterized protein n=1 Tax=Blattamonas nauphoetae TaxID=2049346 RepID=A0ABQ9YBZ0_9EUKA|nr:hypothetical protein BLNAU_22718 [Blattamonas nauphoetae]KAK2946773.1 hypothetical protein BLNAU_18303 [Blattamonas nauphoetae]KAK2950524.1 hypothetical protein BLNAU_14518 [Blattamonas nauphoetae]KAK2961176.1 hypothetical protein BLNAU_3944 [Blattamonas nauphoetae]